MSAQLASAIEQLLDLHERIGVFGDEVERDELRGLYNRVAGLCLAARLPDPPRFSACGVGWHRGPLRGPSTPDTLPDRAARSAWRERLLQMQIGADEQAPPPPSPDPPARPTRRPRHRGRLSVKGNHLLLDGLAVSLDMTADRRASALCFLSHLIRAGGTWISSREINKAEDQKAGKGLPGERWDKVRRELPAHVSALIESRPGAGYRLIPEALA
jgi:hypothetical protein